MTDEKRIEEIRARLRENEAIVAAVPDDDWEDAPREDLPLFDPRLVNPDLAFLLAAIDAERARAVRAEAERDARLAISPEDAREFLRLMVQHDFDMRLRYSDTAVRVGEAINSHAAKAGGRT